MLGLVKLLTDITGCLIVYEDIVSVLQKKKQSSKCQCKCIAQEANTLTIFWEVVQNQ
jgi:hypothetical protein